MLGVEDEFGQQGSCSHTHTHTQCETDLPDCPAQQTPTPKTGCDELDRAEVKCEDYYTEIVPGVFAQCWPSGRKQCLAAGKVCKKPAPGLSAGSPGESCVDLFEKGAKTSGSYYIKPSGAPDAFQVFCDMEDRGDSGGWTLVFGNTGSGFKSFRVGTPSPLLDPKSADGPSDKLEYTLANAKYIKWTDTDFKAIQLAEFQDIGDYYKEVILAQGDKSANAKYLKGDYVRYGWIDVLHNNPDRFGWVFINAGYKCLWEFATKDRPFFNDNGGSNLANKCLGYDPPYTWDGTAKRGGSFDYNIWIKEK